MSFGASLFESSAVRGDCELMLIGLARLIANSNEVNFQAPGAFQMNNEALAKLFHNNEGSMAYDKKCTDKSLIYNIRFEFCKNL